MLYQVGQGTSTKEKSTFVLRDLTIQCVVGLSDALERETGAPRAMDTTFMMLFVTLAMRPVMALGEHGLFGKAMGKDGIAIIVVEKLEQSLVSVQINVASAVGMAVEIQPSYLYRYTSQISSLLLIRIGI